jgi:hypothetical protein
MKNSIIILEKYLKVRKRYFLLEQTISSVIILDKKNLYFFIPETKKKN